MVIAIDLSLMFKETAAATSATREQHSSDHDIVMIDDKHPHCLDGIQQILTPWILFFKV